MLQPLKDDANITFITSTADVSEKLIKVKDVGLQVELQRPIQTLLDALS